jgi:Retrotransposon gag protein/Zinc knuckle
MAQQAHIEQALAAHERVRKSTELPLFHGLKDKDTITAHDFIERFEVASRIANWVPVPAAGQPINYARKCEEFYMLLRGEASKWYLALGHSRDFDYTNWPNLKAEFLKSHAPKYTARTACMSFTDLAQRNGETVHAFYLRVMTAYRFLRETRPDQLFDLRAAIVDVDIDNVAARQLAHDNAVLAAKREGIEDMGRYFTQQLFAAGLTEEVRIRIMDGVINDLAEAYERALTIEAVLKDKRGAKPIVSSIHRTYEEDEDEEILDDEDEELLDSVNALRAKRGKKPIRGFMSTKSKLDVKCRYCKKLGHFQRDCLKRKRENGAMLDKFGKPFKLNPIQDEDENELDEEAAGNEEAIQSITSFYGINSISQECQTSSDSEIDEDELEYERRSNWYDEVGDPEELCDQELGYNEPTGYIEPEHPSKPSSPNLLYPYWEELEHHNSYDKYFCPCMFNIMRYLHINHEEIHLIRDEEEECFCGIEGLFQEAPQDIEDWYLTRLFGEEEYPVDTTYVEWIQERMDKEWSSEEKEKVEWYELHYHFLEAKTRTKLREAKIREAETRPILEPLCTMTTPLNY